MATIPNYSVPQSIIRQVLQVVTGANAAARNAVVLGLAYQLQRYGMDAKTSGTSFASAGVTVPFLYKETANSAEETKTADRLADDAFTRLFAEGLEAETFNNITAGEDFFLEALSQPSVIRLDAATNLAGTNLHTDLRGRAIAIGDIVSIEAAGQTRRRVVTGLVGRRLAADYGSDGANGNIGNSDFNPATGTQSFATVSAPAGFTLSTPDANAFNGLVQGAYLEGKYGEEFTLTVANPGAPGAATFNIASTSGLFAASAVASTNSSGDYSITSAQLGGMVVKIASTVGNVVAGQQFKFRVFSSYTRLATNQLVLSDTGAGYTGARNTTYLVRVKVGTSTGYAGAVLEISDTAGADTPSEVTVVNNTNFNVGSYGLRAQFATAPGLPVQGGLRTGDVYFVKAVAASSSTTEFDGVTLDGPAVDTGVFLDDNVALTEVSFRIEYTGEIARNAAAGGIAWSVDAIDGVDVLGGLSLFVSSRAIGYQWVPFVDGVGELFTTWRAALPASAAPVFIDSLDAIANNFGRLTPANELAFGAWRALSAGQAVYAVAVAADGPSEFAAALTKLENADKYYSLAILSDRRDVRQVASAHVSALSAPNKKRWRIAFCATESPGSYAVVNLNSVGGNFTAVISAYSGGNRLVTASNFGAGDGFVAREIDSGDRFVLGTGEEYEVESVLSQTELVLVSGPVAPISPAVPFRVFKADTPETQAEFVGEESQALGDRRVRNVWIEGGTAVYDGVTQVVASKFHAAELAGVRAAIAPQQGLTRWPITTSTSAAPTYTRYSETNLNHMAERGTLVLAEDADQGGVYVRHQLTTGVDGGILYYEDSVTAVADALAFQFKAIVDKYIGKKNVTARTIAQLQHDLTITLNSATQVATSELDIGPLITDYRNLVVEQDAVLLDRVKISVEVDVAVPLNGVDADIRYVPTTVTIVL